MSKKVRFELNIAGLNELMKGAEMQACLQEAGEAVAEASGIECGVRVHIANYVAIANVYPDSEEAAHENYENNNLLHGLGSVGLNILMD